MNCGLLIVIHKFNSDLNWKYETNSGLHLDVIIET